MPGSRGMGFNPEINPNPPSPTHRFDTLIADEAELTRFIEWLPPLKETEAYRLMMMVRSTPELKIRGGGDKLETGLVHGYDRALVSFNGRPVEFWRFRYYLIAKRMAVGAVHADWYIVKYDPSDINRITSVFKVPPSNIAIYTTINPLSFIKASIATAKEIMDSLANIALTSEPLKRVFKRPDERYKDLAMRYMYKRYYVVDVDDPDLSGQIYKLVAETLGYKPAKIITRRGVHVLVNIEKAKKDGSAKKLFGVANQRMHRLLSEYKKRVAKGESAERIAAELMDYVWGSNDPLFERLKIAGKIYVDHRGVSLVEVKDTPLEPLPGTYYKGIIVRFDMSDEKHYYDTYLSR